MKRFTLSELDEIMKRYKLYRANSPKKIAFDLHRNSDSIRAIIKQNLHRLG